ncbi:hypothetical protein BKA66DRAFT_569358 [Pyrenochaeta sp. MPI-SDFR-AT-0127]|nr:hypothetical protein BKA66DRAFT_569358 [Pyrenochaeta sp. MPI-SDFR-AT-0127]
MQAPRESLLRWRAEIKANREIHIAKTRSKIPAIYTEVGKAGSGLFGDVYTCLPADTVASARSSDMHSMSELARQLVAVKIGSSFDQDGLTQEVKILKAIRNQVEDHPAERHFFKLIEWNTITKGEQWMVSSTLPICCNLQTLEGHFDKMPEDFLWLVYTQLQEAMSFLHNDCKPSIAHGDLHKGNIVIGFSNADNLGLPQLKVLDFGTSTFFANDDRSSRRLRNDTHNFLCVIDFLIHESSWVTWDENSCNLAVRARLPANRTPEFYIFHGTLNMALEQREDVDPVVLQTLWKQFGNFAILRVASISEASKKQIQDVIMELTKGKYDESVRRMLELVDRHSE